MYLLGLKCVLCLFSVCWTTGKYDDGSREGWKSTALQLGRLKVFWQRISGAYVLWRPWRWYAGSINATTLVRIRNQRWTLLEQTQTKVILQITPTLGSCNHQCVGLFDDLLNSRNMVIKLDCVATKASERLPSIIQLWRSHRKDDVNCVTIHIMESPTRKTTQPLALLTTKWQQSSTDCGALTLQSTPVRSHGANLSSFASVLLLQRLTLKLEIPTR
jgi:hypothetical protein